jgi:hypothetical protein
MTDQRKYSMINLNGKEGMKEVSLTPHRTFENTPDYFNTLSEGK